MQFSRSRQRFPQLRVVDSSPSTNDELRGSEAPDFSIVVTDHQTAGRGRLGRSWISPAGQTLAVSVLLRPRDGAGRPVALDHIGWLPLLAGLAMAEAVEATLQAHGSAARVGLKWPNDVQIAGLKASGILSELDRDAVVVGAGLNVAIPAESLPTPVSTSLALHLGRATGSGAGRVSSAASSDAAPSAFGPSTAELCDIALLAFLERFEELYRRYCAHGGDADAAGLRAEVTEACTTVGEPVLVHLPGDQRLRGTAEGIDHSGRLLVRAEDGVEHAVAAGDITHLRYE
ncbi:biotin--[acetyl-CoA-carboxylase] ligase [Ruicaihuangia caeni]|uniref:biotin--[acetyl-CoA-carboxylase] ligase n=1 Tax=Ruicaihuangia caeni TaxID=3042517 RepID=UPI00338DCDB6